MRALVIAPGLLAAAAAPAAGQGVAVGDPLEDYLRLLQIAGLADPGSFTVRPLPVATDVFPSDGHPWAGRFRPGAGADGEVTWRAGDTRLRLFANSDRPTVENDGAVWQGRGLTAALETRASVRWRALTATFHPLLTYDQNASFTLATVLPTGQPTYAYPWRVVDLPQRFGPDGYWDFDLGQSELAVRWKGARVSAGTRSLWWGPGVRNAIIMSNNAAGFPHVSLSTSGPIDIRIGSLEGQWIWGGLRQSDYFDPDADPERFFTGAVLAYGPSFLPGLTLGMTRVFQELVPDGGLDASEYFVVFQGLFKRDFRTEQNPSGTDERDQLLSLFARWVLAESGFEAYVEWARNDHSGDLTDLVLEPEHSRGYTLGFQKVLAPAADRMLALRGEITQLESAATFQLRPRPTYYEHSVVTQGYTNEGQVIGAGVGPGGNAQFLGLDLYARWGRAGLFGRRQVHDNDAFWVYAEANDLSFDRHHVSVDLGASGLVFLGELELGAGFILTRELNRYFMDDEGWNVNASLSARWRGR